MNLTDAIPFSASYIARVVNLEKASYKVQIWDTAGQEQVSHYI